MRHTLRAPGSPSHVIRGDKLDRAVLTAGRPAHVDGIDLAADWVVGTEEGGWVQVPGFRVETVDAIGAGNVFH